MKLTISTSELTSMIKQQLNKDVALTVVGVKTMKVNYTLQVKIPFVNTYVSKDISLDVTYDRIVNENLLLSYSAGMGN